MKTEYHTWDTVTKKTVLPSAADEYLAARKKRGGRRHVQGRTPRLIKVRYPASCCLCGAELAVGAQAKWYGQGRVAGLSCCLIRTKP